MRSTCDACHKPKNDLRAILCEECSTLRKEAEQHYAAENPNAAQSDILYAGRMVLNQVRHHANRNFVDPRDFSLSRGMIPIPPQPRS
jgi:hypothetical protein